MEILASHCNTADRQRRIRFAGAVVATLTSLIVALSLGPPGPAARAAPGGSASAQGSEPAEMNFARCDLVMVGSGGADWRRDSRVSGPAAVFHRPISQMTRYAYGMVTKMPILIVGHRTVRVSVPKRMRGRVFLYYGRFLDRNGKRTTGFANARGHTRTEFHPCDDKPRTIWPGGIRIRGMKPVRLRIDVTGRDRPYFLNLGRPKLYRPQVLLGQP